MSNHPTREFLPGYALGCLEEAEERAVREHLAGCAECRDELASFQEVTGSLALSVAPATPPAELEGRIAERIRGAMREEIPRGPGAPARDSAPTAAQARARLPPRRALPYRLRAIGAVAAILIVALATGNVLQLKTRGARGTPDTTSLTTAVLKGTAGLPDAYGTIVLDPEDNRGVLAVRGLPRLDEGHQYQLWLIRGSERRSGGVFSVSTDGYGSLMLDVPPDFKGFRAMGISVEPTGGSPGPTSPAVMRGAL